MNVVVICSSGGPASDPGRLSSSDISVHVTVRASNSPYGVYVFANGSRHVSIAEDFSDQSSDITSASLLVEKTSGAADYVQVILPLLLLLLISILLLLFWGTWPNLGWDNYINICQSNKN